MTVFAQATPTGVLDGGWFYIWMAYILTWSVFSLYGLSLLARSVRGGSQ